MGHVDVPVVLIPRPDNESSKDALSVAAPASFGGNVDDRLLGYVRSRDLWNLAQIGLHELARYSGWEIACTGIYFADGGLSLALNRDEIAQTVPAFLDRAPESPPLPTVTLDLKHTRSVLKHLGRFPSSKRPLSALAVTSALPSVRQPRRLDITDTATGDVIGHWHDGWLALDLPKHGSG